MANILQDLQQKYFDLLKPVSQGLSSIGKNVTQGAANVQHFIESPQGFQLPTPTQNFQRDIQPALSSIINSSSSRHPQHSGLLSQNAGKVIGGLANLPAQVISAPVNEAVNTSLDVGRIGAAGLGFGDRKIVPQYNQLKSGLAKGAYQIASAVDASRVPSAKLGIKTTPQEVLGNVGQAAGPYAAFANGIGFGGNGSTGAIDPGFWKTIGKAAIQGYQRGFPTGFLNGLNEFRSEQEVKNQIIKSAQAGNITGSQFALLGGIIAGGKYGIDARSTKEALKYLTSEEGQKGSVDLNAKLESYKNQNPDLKKYETALNDSDVKTLTELGNKYPGDTRFQVHTLMDFNPNVEGQTTSARNKALALQLDNYQRASTGSKNIGDLVNYGGDDFQIVAQKGVSGDKWLLEGKYGRQKIVPKLEVNQLPSVGKTEPLLDSLNPTGGLNVKYDPESRVAMQLGKNITTYDKTASIAPDELVTIYRGAPESQKAINPGDFITTNYDLAKSYNGNGNVISMQVKAKDILDDVTQPLGDEYIYRPHTGETGLLSKLGLPTNMQEAQKGAIDFGAKVGKEKDKQPGQLDLQNSLQNGDITPEEAKALGFDVRQVVNGAPVKERGFITSVKESPVTPQRLKDIISGNYVVKTNPQLKADALDLIRQDPQAAEQLALNPRSDVDVQVGNELIKHYGATGDFQKAQQIAEGMANSGTDFGRAVQAYSQYDKTTPEGALRFAQMKINEYNRANPDAKLKASDDQVKQLFEQAHTIQGMEQGRERNIAANQLIEKVNNLIPSSVADKAIAVWKAGLLTSLRTTERNLLGNTIQGQAEYIKDYPAALVDKALALRTGERTLTATNQGVKEGSIEGGQAALDTVKYGFDPQEAISKYDLRHVTWGNNPVEQGLKKYTDIVFRTLAAQDKPFYSAAYARSLYDQAGAEAINAGKQGDAGFIKDLVGNPTEAMLLNAKNDANVATFHDANVLGEIANSFKHAASKSEFTKVISEGAAPFTGVPTSVAGNMISYSPIGLVKGIAKAGKVAIQDVPALQRQASQEVGRGVVGTGLISLGVWLAGQGLITGQQPTDPKEVKQWQLEGKQPNSILIGGKWRSINSVGPQNLILLAGAKLQEELAKGKDASIGNYGASLAKDFASQTFLQGVQQPLAAINDPKRYGQSYLGNQVSSVVPNIVKDTSKAFDTFQRENNNIGDYITNALPGFRNNNIVKRDALGSPVAQEPTGAGAYLDLFNSKTPVDDPVTNELGRLNIQQQNATPSTLQKTQTINGTKQTLTPEQLNVLETEVGKQTRPALQQLIQSPDYQALSDEDKSKAIGDTISTIRKDVRDTVDLNQAQPIPVKKQSNAKTGVNQALADTQATAIVPNQKGQDFTSSADSPQNIVDLITTYAHGAVVDPENTIKALFTQERLRKVSGNAVIFERQTNLNDTPGTSDAVDHIIPLSLGGDNSPSNLKYMDKTVKAKKDALEKKLAYQLSNNQISKQEAQQQIRDYITANPQVVPSRAEVEAAITPTPPPLTKLHTKIGTRSTTIDLAPPTPGQGIDAFTNKNANVTKAIQVFKSSLPQDRKGQAYQQLGVTADDVRYAYLASHNTDISTQYIISKSPDHAKLIDNITTGRVVGINGQQFATNAVIASLQEQGLLSPAEATALKKIKTNANGQSIVKATGAGKKGKVIKVKALKPFKVKLKKPGRVKTYKLTRVPVPKTKVLKRI